MKEDHELLREYADDGSEAAFAELVRRHVDLVHSAALRQLNGDHHLAADVTQEVFTALARKASELARHRVLAGWLFTSTRFAAANAVRAERRRQDRETEAQLMDDLRDDSHAAADWGRVRPVLDQALCELAEEDRAAILLRYFEGRDFSAVGAQLEISANTARMRVERALEKLQARLSGRGVTSTATALALALESHAVIAAPAGMAAAVSGAALAGASAAAGTGLLAFMSMTKLQLGIIGALALVGTAGFVVQAKTSARLEDELTRLDRDRQAAAVVREENLRLEQNAAETNRLRADAKAADDLQREADALKYRLRALAAAADPANAPTIDASQATVVPKAIYQARPHYPASLAKSRTPGDVEVEFVADINGNVRDVRVVKSTIPEFETPVVEALKKWKFSPGEKDQQRVNTIMRTVVHFTPDRRAE